MVTRLCWLTSEGFKRFVSKRVFGLQKNLLQAHSEFEQVRRLPDWPRPLLEERLGLPIRRLSKKNPQQLDDSLFPIWFALFLCSSIVEGLNLRTSVVHHTRTRTTTLVETPL